MNRRLKFEVAYFRRHSKNAWLSIILFISIVTSNHIIWVIWGTPFIALHIIAGLREYGYWHDLMRQELNDFHYIEQAKRRNGFLIFLGGTLLSIVIGLIVAFIVGDLDNNRFEMALSFAIFANVLSLPTLWFARRYFFIERARVTVSFFNHLFYISTVGMFTFIWGYGPLAFLGFVLVYMFIFQRFGRENEIQLYQLIKQQALENTLKLPNNISSWRRLFIPQHSFDYNCALVLIELERLDEAKLILDHILQAKNNIRIPADFYLDILNRLALTELGINAYPPCRAYLRTALNLNTRLNILFPALHDNLAMTYMYQNQSPEIALHHFNEAIAQSEATAQRSFLSQVFLAKTGRAWALAKLGQLDVSEKALPKNASKFINDVPVYTIYVYRLGQTLLAQGKIDLALEQFEMASNADKDGFIGNQAREMLAQIVLDISNSSSN